MKYTVIDEEQAELMFDEYLDDSNEPIKIGSFTFYPSRVLFKCDPIAYSLSLDEFIEHLKENADIYVLGINDDEKPTDEEEQNADN